MPNPTRTAVATLGGGCFWCLDAVFREIQGVESVVCGYAGGHTPNPTYRDVCTDTTGHAEVVQIRFDPNVLGYRDLLQIFFAIHDPTTPDRQGADVGSQYRSVILWHDEGQRVEAEAVLGELAESESWPDPIVTQLVPLEEFYPAEESHQDYRARNPGQAYCRIVIDPKLAKARLAFRDRLKRGGS